MSTPATVTATTLNVRAAGSGTAALLGQLARGTRVNVLARDGNWYRIASGTLTGFVHGDYVRIDSAPTASGFLCHDETLCAPTLALAASPERRIPVSGHKPVAQTAAKAWNRYGGVLDPLCR